MLTKPTASPAGSRSCGMLTATACCCSAPIAARPIAGTRSSQWAGCYSLFATRCKVTQSSAWLTTRGLGAAGFYPCVTEGKRVPGVPLGVCPPQTQAPRWDLCCSEDEGLLLWGGLGAPCAFPIHSEPPEGVCEPTRSWACIPPPLKSSQLFWVKKPSQSVPPAEGCPPLPGSTRWQLAPLRGGDRSASATR